MRRLTVWIDRHVLQRMAAEATGAAPLETGGVLMGYTSQSGDEIIVSNFIGPGPKARHMRSSFAPDLDFQDHEIARRYRDSGRVTTYLGDWHSHPGGGARLSWIDRRTLRRIRDHEDARIPEPLMAVLHGSPPFHLTVWRLQKRRHRSGSTLRRARTAAYTKSRQRVVDPTERS